MPEPVQQRFVPGAPPPPPPSKSQRKKRKPKTKNDSPDDSAAPDATSPAPIQKAPEPVDLHQPPPAPELAVQDSQGQTVPEDDFLNKHNPIVELVSKRLKATNKKIARISSYAAMDADKLDDDQKRTLKTLPVLEAIQKELTEVKKAIEIHENEVAHELAAKRVEAEKAEKARIQDAVAAAQSDLLSKTGDIFNLLRIRNSLANGEIDPSALSLQGAEATAIYSAADALLSEDGDHKQAAIAGFLVGEGDLDGVSYSRLIEITTLALNPPREPTPEPEEPAVVTTDEVPSTASITGPSEPEAPVTGVPGSIATSNSFRFMQDSELEGPFDDTPSEVPQQTVPAQEVDDDAAPPASVNGLPSEEDPAAPPADAPATIDWAADETAEELPSIAGLHAEFGTSGSATPAEQPAPVNGEGEANPAPPQPEDDGFTQAGGRGHRGDHRGRGRGGYRGDRGGYRGYRGHGERGGGGYRGGYRRNDERGRGGFRGRGDYRGDGERRGGGRGRGRGDRGGPHHAHGSSSPAPTPAPAAST